MSPTPARRWIEALATVLAVLSLWPWILGWTHPLWKVFMYFMLAVMLALFIANIRRLWRLGHPGPT